MSESCLQTLGDLRLWSDRDGSETLIGPSKSLAVLAYVAGTPGRTASRDHVARLIWPDFERSRARRSLRQALYYLHRQADCTLVEPGDGDLSVAEDALRVDLWAFERALQDADYETAVEIYDGPFLGGFSVDGGREFEGWVETRNERIWSGLKAAYHEVVTGALDGGAAEKAVRYARQYVELNPLDESAREALIRAHLARGDRVAAYRAFEEHTRLLDEELGAEPSESLRRRVEGLEEDIFRWPVEGPTTGRDASAGSSADPGEGAGAASPPGEDTDGGRHDGGGRARAGGWRGVFRRMRWALVGGVAATLAVTALAATGWWPFAGAADAGSPWGGVGGRVDVLIDGGEGTTRATLTVQDGKASRLRPTGLEAKAAVSPGRTWRAEPTAGRGGPDLRVVHAASGRVEAEVATEADEQPLAWSPDGRRLLFQAGWLDAGTGDYRRRLRVLRRRSGEVSELPVSLPAPGASVQEAAWSPRGTRIALAFESADGDQEVFLVRADGSRLRDVSGHPGWDGHPAWSPDGRWLVFSSRRGGTVDLFMAAADGHRATRLTSGPADEVHPKWLTSRHLVYVRRPAGTEEGGSLQLLDVETRRTRTLLDGRRVERVFRGLAPSGDPGARVESVALRAPSDPLSPGLTTGLRAAVETGDGDTLSLSRIPASWSVGDTTVARVGREDGRLAVRDTGDVRVTVSAGGWRSDTVRLRSRPVRRRATDPLLREDWSRGVDPGRWETVGDPEPYVTRVRRDGGGPADPPVAGPGDTGPAGAPGEPPAHAFVNNGDENYDSGVVSRRPVPLDDGCTVEFWARTPFTRELFQGLKVILYRGDRGPSPGGRHRGPDRLAAVTFGPGSEGPNLRAGEESVRLRPVGEPDRWHRYALQLHPDGRVSWVVDGVIRWRSAEPLLDDRPDRARLFVGGRSVGTEVQVGPVRVWRNVGYVAGGD